MLMISVVVILLVLICVLSAFAYKVSKLLKALTPSETQVFNDELVILKDGISNIYLIKGSDGYIAVDAGRNIRELTRALKAVNIKTEDIRAVLLTHSDPDHVKGIEIFKRAIVYLPQKEEALANGIISRGFGIFKNYVREGYITIEEDKDFEILGRRIIPRTYPGHTPGSTAYEVDQKYLFTGDILELKGNKAVGFIKFFNMDHALNKVNYLKVKDLINYEYLFTGHSGYIKKEDILWD